MPRQTWQPHPNCTYPTPSTKTALRTTPWPDETDSCRQLAALELGEVSLGCFHPIQSRLKTLYGGPRPGFTGVNAGTRDGGFDCFGCFVLPKLRKLLSRLDPSFEREQIVRK